MAGAALALGTSAALALDPMESAEFNVRVTDATGRPVAGATVLLKFSEQHPARKPVRVTTNRDGEARLQVRLTNAVTEIDHRGSWRIERDGFLPHDAWWSAFPGARIEQSFQLERAATTLIRITGAAAALAHWQPIQIYYASGGYRQTARGRLDEHAEFRFVRPQSGADPELKIGTALRRFPADAKEVAVRLTEKEARSLLGDHVLAGRLLLADGQPAKGWWVARDTELVSSGGSNRGPMIGSFAAANFFRTGRSGKFRIEHCGEFLLIRSPEGLPFLYPLNPRSWDEPVHAVTITLPEVRRIHRGTLLFENGSPASGHPIQIRQVHSEEGHWNLNRSAFGAVPSGTQPPDEITRTRRDGAYELPIYFGAQHSFSPMAPLSVYDNGLTSAGQVTLHSRASQPAGERKRVTLRFVDERGAILPDIRLYEWDGFAGGRSTVTSSGGSWDAGGWNIFVKKNTGTINIRRAQGTNWNEFSRRIDVSGETNRVVEISVPDSLHRSVRQSLRGRLIDPDGRPVADATLYPFTTSEQLKQQTGINAGPMRPNRIFHGLKAVTDADGQFRFEWAPEECFLNIHRYGADGNTVTLPGWLAQPPSANASNRDLLIRLQPAGSVRVLTPSGLTTNPKSVYLMAGESADITSYRVTLSSNGLHAPFVAPGAYQLVSYNPFEFGPISNITVSVRAGEETVIDLSSTNYLPAPERGHAWLAVRVLDGGKPVSGAIVQRHLLGERPAVTGDLSDARGRVRIDTEAGAEYVVVARVPGKLIGWQRVRGSGFASNLDLALGAVRTLELELPALPDAGTRNFYDGRMVSLQAPGLDDSEARALFITLGLAEKIFYGRSQAKGVLWSDLALTRVAEDLPVNLPLAFEVTRSGQPQQSGMITLTALDPRVRPLKIEAAK